MRNVLLLTIDALRARNLSCYGYGRETTPRIDELASRSRVFERAYTHGTVTTLAFPAMLGGVHTFAAERIERRSVSPVLLQYAFPPYFPSLPELFRSAGYRTAGFHANALLSYIYGYDRGFDTFYDGLEHKFQIRHRRRWRVSHWLRRYPLIYRNLLRVRDRISPMPPERVSGELNERALSFIDYGEGPFFVWVHYMDVHHPMLPSPEHCFEVTGRRFSRAEITHLNRLRFYGDRTKRRRVEDLMAIYDATIWETDRWVGDLLDAMDERGLLDDLVVALTSDHGEAFMEHGHLSHPSGNFHDEQLHVPLIISGNGRGRHTSPVGHVDLAPTLMSMAGLAPSPDFLGTTLPHEEGVVHSGARLLDDAVLAITTSRFRFIWHMEADRVELYDLVDDPGEREDLSSERRGAVEAFRELGSAHLDTVERRAIDLKMRWRTEAAVRGTDRQEGSKITGRDG